MRRYPPDASGNLLVPHLQVRETGFWFTTACGREVATELPALVTLDRNLTPCQECFDAGGGLTR